MDIDTLLTSDTIKLDLKADTKQKAIEELCDVLIQNGAIENREEFLKDVMRREEISSTAIGNGVAIPHGKSAAVLRTAVALGRLETECKEWESFDKKSVKIVILLAVNDKDKTGLHLKLLTQMAKKLAYKDICDALCDAKSEQNIIDILKNKKEM